MADLEERGARLNTLMRFKRYKQALPHAYYLRLDLQLAYPVTPKIEGNLQLVEQVIERLEAERESKVTRYFRNLTKALREAFDKEARAAAEQERKEQEEREKARKARLEQEAAQEAGEEKPPEPAHESSHEEAPKPSTAGWLGGGE